jgi:S-DNA-T family DNA segregation ATPase FtsK/SpoIIIE
LVLGLICTSRDLCSLWLFCYFFELGGVVGYELNLFLQDYLGNRNFIGTNIWIDYLFFLKLKYHLIGLNSFSKIKKLKSDLAVDTGSDLKSEAYNLEFAVNDGMRSANDDFHLQDSTSKFEINKEALKPTISHSSDINLEPALKPLASPVTVVKNETSSEDSFVIET